MLSFIGGLVVFILAVRGIIGFAEDFKKASKP
jgi:hypothetical protein